MRINSDDFINEMDNFGVDMPTDKEFDAVMGMVDDIEKYLNEFGYIEIYEDKDKNNKLDVFSNNKAFNQIRDNRYGLCCNYVLAELDERDYFINDDLNIKYKIGPENVHYNTPEGAMTVVNIFESELFKSAVVGLVYDAYNYLKGMEKDQDLSKLEEIPYNSMFFKQIVNECSLLIRKQFNIKESNIIGMLAIVNANAVANYYTNIAFPFMMSGFDDVDILSAFLNELKKLYKK